ncbi:Uma2 family endonuclease [Yinghuangia aomiensis]|uniref:Uma2 family endonuclease n=1 Tax=Yinghuangia aomiensis TaxID=676205 RepID=A0ABP9I8J7_9ACTN
MTAVAETGMPVETFEQMAELAAEWAHLEFIGGKLGEKALPDGEHEEIVRWLMQFFALEGRDRWLYPERGLVVETYRNGRARPHGTLAPLGSFRHAGEWADASPALMVVEVTSNDWDTEARDRVDKPRAYAEVRIPVYLLIDRKRHEMLVHSEPDDGVYATIVTRPFGKPLHLPEPVGVVLDTDHLLDWAD